jgi:hypothetical protein
VFDQQLEVGGAVLRTHHDGMADTIEADLAVAPMLTLTVPKSLRVLGAAEGLPPLPVFYINLRLPHGGATDVAQEMAKFIRAGFATPYHSAVAA